MVLWEKGSDTEETVVQEVHAHAISKQAEINNSAQSNHLLAAGQTSKRTAGRYNATAQAMATCRGEKGPGANAM